MKTVYSSRITSVQNSRSLLTSRLASFYVTIDSNTSYNRCFTKFAVIRIQRLSSK